MSIRNNGPVVDDNSDALQNKLYRMTKVPVFNLVCKILL